MRRRRLNTKGIIAFCTTIILSIALIFAIIDKIRYEINESEAYENYQLVINGQKIEANEIISKKNFAFNHFEEDYTDVKVPKNTEINLEGTYSITNEKGEKLKGDITYLPDGKYTLKTKVNDYSYVYYLNVDNDFYVEIDQTYSKQGGFVVASFHDLNEGEEVTIHPAFTTSDDFLFNPDSTVIPIDFNSDAGEQTITFKSKNSSTKSTISIAETKTNDIVLYWPDYAAVEDESDEYKAYIKATKTITDEKYYTSFQTPATGTIVSNYGDRYVINNSQETTITNLAIDYANSLNTPVKSTSNGKVIYTGSLERQGNVVVVDHGQGIISTYHHLNEISVKVGDTLSGGDEVGKMGQSGNVTGIHVNFEIHINGIKVNPDIFLKEELNF